MSFQTLSKLLPKDVVDHCIVPYLGPSVESSKAQFAKVLEQLQTVDPWKDKTGIFFTTIRGRVPDKIAEIREQNYCENDQDLLNRRYLLQSYPADLIDSLTPSAMDHLYIRVNEAREDYLQSTGTKLGNKLSQMMNEWAENRMAQDNEDNEDMEDDVLDYYTLDEYEGETEEDRRQKAIEDASRVRAIPIKVDRTPHGDTARLVCRMNAEGQVFCRRVKNYKGYSGIFCVEEDGCQWLKDQKRIKKSDPKYKDLLYNDQIQIGPL